MIFDKELLLIEAMAQDLHYTNIKWENVKSFYFPQWLSIQYQQEANFKNAQLTITSSISQSLSESGMKMTISKRRSLSKYRLISEDSSKAE